MTGRGKQMENRAGKWHQEVLEEEKWLIIL